jgi:hypothetical protein
MLPDYKVIYVVTAKVGGVAIISVDFISNLRGTSAHIRSDNIGVSISVHGRRVPCPIVLLSVLDAWQSIDGR